MMHLDNPKIESEYLKQNVLETNTLVDDKIIEYRENIPWSY